MERFRERSERASASAELGSTQRHYRRRGPGAVAGRPRRGAAAGRRASPRPATASTWSAGSCATCCSGATSAPTTTSTSPPTPDPTASSRLVGPLADAVWSQGERFGTIGCRIGGAGVRDHDPPGRGLLARTRASPRSSSPTPSRPTSSAATSPSTPWRSTLPEPRAGRPVRRRGRPRRRAAAHAARRRRSPSPTTRCACCGPPASSPATASCPTTSWWRRSASWAAGSRSCRPSASATSSTSCIVVDDPAAGLWFLVDTGLAEQFLPELPAMRLEQDPIHRHKDVLAHTIAVVGNVSARKPDGASNRITRLAALFHDVGKPKTRSYRQGRRRDVPPPRGGRRPHDPRPHAGAALLERRRRAASRQLVFLHLRFHTYRLGWTDSAVRRFVRDAGDQLDELIELTRCDCTTRNERKARTLRTPHGRARGAHRRARGAGGARRHPARPRRHARSWTGSACRPGPVVGEALAFLLELRLDEGPLDPRRPAAASTRGGPSGRADRRRRLVRRRAGRGVPHPKLWIAHAVDGELVALAATSRRGAVADDPGGRGSPRRRPARRARLLVRLPGVVHGRARLRDRAGALGPDRRAGRDPAAVLRRRRAPPPAALDRRYRETERRLREQGLRCGSTFQVRGPGSVGTGTLRGPAPPGRPGSGRPAGLALRPAARSRGGRGVPADVHRAGREVAGGREGRGLGRRRIAGADRAGRAGRARARTRSTPRSPRWCSAAAGLGARRAAPVAALEGWALGA